MEVQRREKSRQGGEMNQRNKWKPQHIASREHNPMISEGGPVRKPLLSWRVEHGRSEVSGRQNTGGATNRRTGERGILTLAIGYGTSEK